MFYLEDLLPSILCLR